MFKRILSLSFLFVLTAVLSGRAGGDLIKVGAHVKLTLYDAISGSQTGPDVAAPQEDADEYVGMSFNEMILYLTGNVSEKIRVDLAPQFMAHTGATPRIGKPIGEREDTDEIIPEFEGWSRATITAILPEQFELSAGIMKPRFTWDYGAELFWEDVMNGSPFTCSDWLGGMHDTGLELYRPFEFSAVSLPVYLYLLNGESQFADNNNAPLGMLRIEPEFGPVRLAGSFAHGKYDDEGENNVTRWSYGIALEKGPFASRAEYAEGIWEDEFAFEDMQTIDAKPKGYYAQISYRVAKWLRATLNYSVANFNFGGYFYVGSTTGERYETLTPSLQFYVARSSIIQVQYDIADAYTKDGGENLDYERLTAGWRTTF